MYVGCRCGSDPVLLWLCYRPAATAPIGPLAWEPPHAMGVVLKRQKEQQQQQQQKKPYNRETILHYPSVANPYGKWVCYMEEETREMAA